MKIQTFQKTKIYIDVVQFEGGREHALEVCRWIGGGSSYIPATATDPREYLQVPTMFGPRDAKVGQYIVKLENETFLVYKHEALFSEYMPANADENAHWLVKHAIAELARFPNEDMDFKQSLVNAIVGFTSYRGHSGASAEIATHMITALLRGDNLLPLTDDPEEWTLRSAAEFGADHDLWQNKRNSKAISEDGGKTYYRVDEVREENPFKDDGTLVDVKIYTSEPHDFVPEIDPNDLETPSDE